MNLLQLAFASHCFMFSTEVAAFRWPRFARGALGRMGHLRDALSLVYGGGHRSSFLFGFGGSHPEEAEAPALPTGECPKLRPAQLARASCPAVGAEMELRRREGLGKARGRVGSDQRQSLPTLDADAAGREPVCWMGKKSKATEKGKKVQKPGKKPSKRAWRKADVEDVEEALEDERLVNKLKKQVWVVSNPKQWMDEHPNSPTSLV
eukprot:Skav232612  [mRNA]  locus=scaffold1224:529689:543113:+ [translate_table: standard]